VSPKLLQPTNDNDDAKQNNKREEKYSAATAKKGYLDIHRLFVGFKLASWEDHGR
jgi:hypothetical protein